jgi:chromosome segregation ATPase
MDLSKRIKEMEQELIRLKTKEAHIEHDIKIFHQVFNSLKSQFEQMKKDIGRHK